MPISEMQSTPSRPPMEPPLCLLRGGLFHEVNEKCVLRARTPLCLPERLRCLLLSEGIDVIPNGMARLSHIAILCFDENGPREPPAVVEDGQWSSIVQMNDLTFEWALEVSVASLLLKGGGKSSVAEQRFVVGENVLFPLTVRLQLNLATQLHKVKDTGPLTTRMRAFLACQRPHCTTLGEAVQLQSGMSMVQWFEPGLSALKINILALKDVNRNVRKRRRSHMTVLEQELDDAAVWIPPPRARVSSRLFALSSLSGEAGAAVAPMSAAAPCRASSVESAAESSGSRDVTPQKAETARRAEYRSLSTSLFPPTSKWRLWTPSSTPISKTALQSLCADTQRVLVTLLLPRDLRAAAALRATSKFGRSVVDDAAVCLLTEWERVLHEIVATCSVVSLLEHSQILEKQEVDPLNLLWCYHERKREQRGWRFSDLPRVLRTHCARLWEDVSPAAAFHEARGGFR